MGLLKYFQFILCSLKFLNEVNCDCSLSLSQDFGSPQPVLLHKGEYLTPNTPSGDITVQRGSKVLVACPGDGRLVLLGNDTKQANFVEARCVRDSTFQAGGWAGQLKDIRCNSHPYFVAEETSQICNGNNKIIRVGYRVEAKFYPLYEVCFDGDLLTTMYSKQQLTPASSFGQTGSRNHFVGGDMFGKVHVAQLYKKKNQITQFNTLLGEGMDKIYLTKNQFLTRGHLSARADFTLEFAQRASFHYINAAPQWLRGNAGDWAALEEALRRRVKQLGSEVTVYTGTHGVLTLADSNKRQRAVYLNVDENNNYNVPVPLYFFKLVYDPHNKTAAAFISINSPYYDQPTINKLIFCDDICEDSTRYKWLRWRNDGFTSFCCSYEQFVDTIKSLPKLDVKGSFY